MPTTGCYSTRKMATYVYQVFLSLAFFPSDTSKILLLPKIRHLPPFVEKKILITQTLHKNWLFPNYVILLCYLEFTVLERVFLEHLPGDSNHPKKYSWRETILWSHPEAFKTFLWIKGFSISFFKEKKEVMSLYKHIFSWEQSSEEL